MIGVTVVIGLAVVGATLVAGAIIGGLIGTATGASVDSGAVSVPVSTTCTEAQETLEEIDRQIAELRDKIDEANRIAATWTSIAMYLGGLSIFAGAIGVLLVISALASGPAGAIPGFGAVTALVASAAFAFAASVALGYAASWRERARQLTADLNLLGGLRLTTLATITRLCGIPVVVEEPARDLAPFE